MVKHYDLTYIYFNQVMIEEVMKKLDLSMTSGPEGVPSILLNKCSESLSFPLFLLWHKSLQCGHFPVRLKDAFINPGLKSGGNKNNPASWRPIALTSQISKFFEKIMKIQIMNHLEANDHIGKFQFGFRKGKSCLSQMIKFYDDITEHLENGLNIDTIYLDMEKAFDRVDLGLLAHRIKENHIFGKVGLWLNSFITNRRQQVLANGKLSGITNNISGVPQGTVLGPVLFLLIIESLGKMDLNCDLSSFADDTKIMALIKSIEDALKLQEDVLKLNDWQKINNMTFNDHKFMLLQFGTNYNLSQEYNYLTPNEDNVILPSNDIRDLGIQISCDGTYKDHISKIISKSNQRISLLLRTFQTREPSLMRQLWRQYVQPIIDYCSQMWCPIEGGQIMRLGHS